MSGVTDGGILTNMAFEQIPVVGPLILVVGIVTFAYSTILGWSYYGERGAEYLWGKKALAPYRLVFCLVLVAAPVLSLQVVWDLADIFERTDGRAEPGCRGVAFGRGGERDKSTTLPAPKRWKRQTTPPSPP